LIKNKKKNVKKIGILGGTFDPPHKGHLQIAKVSLKKLKLNKILWVLTNKNPLKKKPYLSLKQRIKLSKKITKNYNKIFVKYFENSVKSTSTYDLLNYIKKKNKKSELFFLIGADNLMKLHKWKNWQKIPNLAKIIVFPRKSYSLNQTTFKKIYKKDILYIKSKKINISSSLIRKIW
jgi:nicotinate-nucleotide adenylyltransferase